MTGRGIELTDRFRGVLVGTAVGDALGLPTEGLSPRRAARMFPPPWRHRLLPGTGLVSDDTEHSVLVAEALLAAPEDADRFARRLARGLRWWLLALPAGIGLATLRSIVKLWLCFPPRSSGVWSAGNGPAMRVAPIGAFHADDAERRAAFVRASTRLTHRDPKAETGALAVAEIAAWSVRHAGEPAPGFAGYLEWLRACGPGDETWQSRLDAMAVAHGAGRSVPEYARDLGLERGVSGYIHDSVPVVAYAWHRHYGDFESTLTAVLECGGDADTTGAIVGALAGAVTGESGIPDPWIEGIRDWPRGVPLLRRLGTALAAAHAGDRSQRPVPYFWPAALPRNLAFMALVLAHGFRRLLPPY